MFPETIAGNHICNINQQQGNTGYLISYENFIGSYFFFVIILLFCSYTWQFLEALDLFCKVIGTYEYFEYQMNNGFFLPIESIILNSLTMKILILTLEQHPSYNWRSS